MAASDDLAPQLGRPEPAKVEYGQGVLINWDPDTFENTVAWQGVRLSNAIIAPGVDALSLQPGDPVLLLILVPAEEGARTFVVLGRMNVPPLTDPVAIRGGTFIVDSEDGIEVRSGGSVEVKDGGYIRARYADGSSAITYGSLSDQLTGDPHGHGLLIQDNDAGGNRDIFRAKRQPDGSLVVWIAEVTGGGTPNPIDEFASETNLTRIRTYNGGDGFLATFGGGDSVVAVSDGGDAILNVFDTGGAVRLANQDFTVITAYEGDSGVTANCHLTSAGQILRTSSSRRFKQDIRDAEINVETVLRLRPRTWLPSNVVTGCSGMPEAKRKNGADGGSEPASATATKQRPQSRPQVRQVGFVAEELDDIGLGDFVEHDENGDASNIAYDRLTAALVTVCQQQQAQIDTLKDRIDALSGQS